MVTDSKIRSLALLPEQEREDFLNGLSKEEKAALFYNWEQWARPKQLPPEDFFIWLLLSGRGFGKTRAINELVIKWAKEGHTPIALIGQTKADVRDTIVELGDSSILKISPPWFMPKYESSKRRLTWPNGVQAIIYSGDEPDQLRGPQHAKAILDELAKFRYPNQTWANLMMGLRVGDKPQVAIATTPRPIKIIKDLARDERVTITRGHTLENRDNLADDALSYIIDKYQGTRIGRQELAGEILDSLEGLVYDAFNADTCIIPRIAIPPEWPRYTGHDFGLNNAAVVWYAQEPSTGFYYVYRVYKGGKGITERVEDWKELSGEEPIRRKVGGSHNEEEIRQGYSLAGWHIVEPSERHIETQVLLVNELHRKNLIYVFSDLNEYIDEKTSMSWEIDKEDNMTGKIHNESQFHFMACDRYLLSEFKPQPVGGQGYRTTTPRRKRVLVRR